MKTINLFRKPGTESDAVHDRVRHFFARRGYTLSRLYEDTAEYNIVIGGDGTFLRAVHSTNFSPIPFFGINTGHLGFFQEVNTCDLDAHLKRLLDKQYEVHPQTLLGVHVETSAWSYTLLAVNEFLVQSHDSHILHLGVNIDDVDFINTSGDGLMFSTPAGSTAYTLSAGGSILHQTLNGYQITALHPIQSKSFDSLPTSLVLPAESKTVVTVDENDSERIQLIGDGITHRFRGVKRFTFFVPDETIFRVIFRTNWYWKNLRDKLF